MHWLAELDGRRIVVEVPGSSANLGAGYDCLAVALALTNRAVKGPVYRQYRRTWDEERRRSAITARTFLSGRWFQLKREVAEPRDAELQRAA